MIVNLYKFCKREILIQPPGEPREQHIYQPFQYFMKFCVAQTFFVECRLDVVLEVLLMVGLDFFSTKLVDRYHRKIHKKN